MVFMMLIWAVKSPAFSEPLNVEDTARLQAGLITRTGKSPQTVVFRLSGRLKGLSEQLFCRLIKNTCLRHPALPFSVKASIVPQLILY